MVRRKRLLVSLSLALLAGVAALVRGSSRETPEIAAESAGLAGADNIVLIVADTLRADHLPFYGYDRDTAPFLGSLARRSVLFERAYSAASSTAPAMASVFTSLLPSEHGVISGLIAHRNRTAHGGSVQLNRLSGDVTTLAEELRAAGYRTVGIADNINIGPKLGFDQGFDELTTQRYAGAPTVNRLAKERYASLASSGPYFLYLHYMDPHKPYHRRAPWYEPGADPRESAVNAYDSEIRYLDDHIRELFELFRWEENALVIFLSDHGEEFWDHGGDGHGSTLYREVIEVPFFFYHRSLEPRRVEEPAHTADLLPTLASLAGMPARDWWHGEDLSPSFTADPRGERSIVSELLRPGEHVKFARRSLVQGSWHLIHSWRRGEPERLELFDLVNDRSERHDLSRSRAPLVAELRLALDAGDESSSGLHERATIELDTGALEHLRTLGYVN